MGRTGKVKGKKQVSLWLPPMVAMTMRVLASAYQTSNSALVERLVSEEARRVRDRFKEQGTDFQGGLPIETVVEAQPATPSFVAA